MDPIILTDIPFAADRAQLLSKLHVAEGSEFAADLNRLGDEAEALARPKAMYKMVFIEEKGDDYVLIDGVRLSSRVLRVNLDEAHRAFAQVATCGVELQAWAEGLADMLYRFWAEEIKLAALRAASQALDEDLVARYNPGKTSRMNPGSLADWPLREQEPLFTILGDVQAAIGVRLTDSYLMIPNKSTSGLRFPRETSFASCQLCPREGCPGRQAKYDPELYESTYRKRS
jgi:hypothetical protein